MSETALVPVTVFNPTHKKLKHAFIQRVIELLSVEEFDLKSYSVDENYYKSESITLLVEGVTIEIRTKI